MQMIADLHTHTLCATHAFQTLNAVSYTHLLGQIDTACRVAVEAMAHYGEVFFISNGTLRPADRAWAASVTLTCRERENKGLDVGAYKEALAVIGRGRLARYDELVLMNFTLAGPVCSLASMFAAMEARPELAFWGLTRHYAMKSRRFGGRSRCV